MLTRPDDDARRYEEGPREESYLPSLDELTDDDAWAICDCGQQFLTPDEANVHTEATGHLPRRVS